MDIVLFDIKNGRIDNLGVNFGGIQYEKNLRKV